MSSWGALVVWYPVLLGLSLYGWRYSRLFVWTQLKIVYTNSRAESKIKCCPSDGMCGDDSYLKSDRKNNRSKYTTKHILHGPHGSVMYWWGLTSAVTNQTLFVSLLRLFHSSSRRSRSSRRDRRTSSKTWCKTSSPYYSTLASIILMTARSSCAPSTSSSWRSSRKQTARASWGQHAQLN